MYNGEGINALVCVLEDLENSSLIYIEQNVQKLLKCLAYYKEFRDVLAQCAKHFDYNNEKRRALGQIGDSYVFKLPEQRSAMVAFVLNLLVDFDAGEADVIDFSCRYFPAGSKQESFEKFCTYVLQPFKLAIVDFVWNGVDEVAPEVNRTVEFAHNGVREQTEQILVDLFDGIKEAVEEGDERAELVLMLEGLAAALDLGDALMIRALWTGLKRSLASDDICAATSKKLEEVLKLYLVIK